MKKIFIAGFLLVGLLLLALVVYLAFPAIVIVPPNSVALIIAKNTTAVIVPPNKTAVIVPVVPVTPEVPQVVFIGITTYSPKDLAKYQFISNNIVVAFTEAMDPATVNQNTFMVKGPNNVEVKGIITPDATKKVWTFNPIDNIISDAVYNVTVTTGAKGVSGNSLEKNFVWSFTTNPIFAASGPGPSPGGPSPPSPPVRVLTTITLSPALKTLNNGSTQQLTAAGFDQNSDSIAAIITYASSNETVAIVNASGNVTAVGIGNTTITATSGAISDYSIITVVNAGADCPAVAVDLGTSGNYAILTKSGIDAAGTAGTLITGDIAVSPAAATYITGFGALPLDITQCFSTSTLVVGNVYAADYNTLGCTTPDVLTTAISDMETAYTTAVGLADCVVNLGAGNIGGMTLAPGAYKWTTGLGITTDVYLLGTATDVWVFEIAGALDISTNINVHLTGGALEKNVYWVVAQGATLNTNTIFYGNILNAGTLATVNPIALNTGAVLYGRAFTLDGNAVTIPT
jgi:hypothetical protein